MKRRRLSRSLLRCLALVGLVALVACSGRSGTPGRQDGPPTLRVLMVGNPQMLDLQKLTEEGFTRRTGIPVEYTVLGENEVRGAIGQEFASQAGHYDVASVSNFEVPFYAKYGWLSPLDAVAQDPGFDQADVLPSMSQSLTGEDGRVYAEPFYGESSFLMYRKDVFAERGLTMPERPTWPQVAALAAQVDGARPGMAGICLRGLPGWGELAAPWTTVLNTYGGTWYDRDWQARLDSDAARRATEMYVNLVREHGEDDPNHAGFAECLANMEHGRTAMWYDATSAAGLLEAPGSPVAGKLGYAPAPVLRTASSGWLYTWAWGVQRASTAQDQAAKFVAWASSKDYERLVGERLGWSRVPAGKRASTYTNAHYLSSAAAFARQTVRAIDEADPRSPGVQPRPTLGIQFVDVPEFTALGTIVSMQIASAITGEKTVEQALTASQAAAQQVGPRYQGR